jgi:eukaryotic-like serine/threonine-protein kinase
MTPERWRELTQIYGAVVSQAPERRAGAVAELCGADEELRREIESLLAGQHGTPLLDRPVGAHPSVLQLLTVGSQFGTFRIDGLLGVGGMGEVYRARDTKLNRDVAIKILPAAFATDPERVARFKREAQVLASLNHPNIGAIYGFEDVGPGAALVLELVEGPTLADRIAHGPLPMDEALPIARQIVDALECAHEAGVVHRDLKPANIKVRDDGTVKVLDFGLAKLAEPVGAVGTGGAMTQSPTITTPAMTAAGMILGTAAYMSPEQAKGKPADKRSDIWAFGCVLYEMLAGKRAFDADDVADTLAAVLRSDLDWAALPGTTPPRVIALIRRSLMRNPAQRVGDIAVAKFLLAEPEADIGHTTSASKPRGQRREWVAWTVAAMLAIGWLAYSSLRPASFRPAADRRVVRAAIDPPPGTSFLLTGGNATLVQVSPDGTRILFATAGEGSENVLRPKLWLRSIDSTEARPLEGTEGASSPFWSHDGKYIAFFLARRLMKLEVQSGTVSSICDLPAPNGRGGTWNQSGDIVFSVPDKRHLYRVRADGGAPTALTIGGGSDRDQDLYPQFLPDGRHFLFLRKSIDLGREGLYVGSLDSSDSAFVIKSRWNGSVVGGQLLYLAADSTALMAQPIDLARFMLTGSPQRLVDQVGVSGPGLSDSRAQFSASENGVLAYHRTTMKESQITWVDRSGRSLGAVGAPGVFANPRLSPDSTELVVDHWDAQRGDTHVWLFNLSRGNTWPLRTGDGTDSSAVWSADGSEVAFVGAFADAVRLYRKNLKTDQMTTLADLDQVSFPSSWGTDGTLFLSETSNQLDVVTLRRGEKTPRLFAGGPRVQTHGEVSPDGRLIAYFSNESGQPEVYVQPSSGGARLLASTGGGNDPCWSRNGKQLYFEARNTLSQVDVLDSVDGRLQLSAPKPVFTRQFRHAPSSFSNPFPANYALAGNGERFLYLIPTDTDDGHPMTIVVNWQALLKQ